MTCQKNDVPECHVLPKRYMVYCLGARAQDSENWDSNSASATF